MYKADIADNHKLKEIERAAILLLAIGQERAASVLKHMGSKEVQAIGATMAALGSVSLETVDDILEQFIVQVRDQTGLGLDADNYIRNMLTSALGADKAGTIIDRILLGANSKGIEQLKWMDSRAITDLIGKEHPQIIATILSLLDAEQASEVLALLPDAVQADILMRIATLGGIQPAAIKELDKMMEKQIIETDNIKTSALGGVNTVANIINLLDGHLSETMMDEINENNELLAQKIQDKMFIFADLLDVDDRGIQTLLREVSTEQLLLAMRGVDDLLKAKIFGNMSRRAAEMLMDDLEAAPPTKLSEVELAQKDILAIAKQLSNAGEINLGGGSGDELV